jgi:hypothetical protein
MTQPGSGSAGQADKIALELISACSARRPHHCANRFVTISPRGIHGQGSNMSFSRPRSFLQLVLLGFVLVTLPLIIAIINAILSVDRLADQSEQAVLAYRTPCRRG